MPPKDISRKHFRQFSLHCMTGFEPQIFQQRNADALQWLSETVVRCSASVLQCATVHFSDWSFQTGATMCIATKSLGKGEGGQIFMNQWWCQLPMFAFHVKGSESERKRNSGFNAKFKSYGQTGKLWIYGKLGSAKWKIEAILCQLCCGGWLLIYVEIQNARY